MEPILSACAAGSAADQASSPPLHRPTVHRPRPLERLTNRLLLRLEELHDTGAHPVSGISTGFHDLDRITSGMHGGQLIVVASRPSVGKSSFALNIAEHVALEQQLPVVIFSLEIDRDQLIERLTSSTCRIHHQILRTGALQDSDWIRLSENISRLDSAPIFVEDAPTMTMESLRLLAREHAAHMGKLGLIVVDSLQLMNGRELPLESRAVELSGISRGLKALARELECPILVVCQLNRALEVRRDKRPLLGDLRDSGAIEEDADLVLFIYRDAYYNKDSKEPGIAEIIIGKQRSGALGTVKLSFAERIARFDNLPAMQRQSHKSMDGG
jgi:replicative DNA helicase